MTNSESARRYRERHPDRKSAQDKIYYRTHKLECREGLRRRSHLHPEKRIYYAMFQRCTNPNNSFWKDYGGRGIQFLYTSFEQFLGDVGERPEGKDARGKSLYSIDRKENDGHYQPGNCKWSTQAEQALNRRKKYVTHATKVASRARTAGN